MGYGFFTGLRMYLPLEEVLIRSTNYLFQILRISLRLENLNVNVIMTLCTLHLVLFLYLITFWRNER